MTAAHMRGTRYIRGAPYGSEPSLSKVPTITKILLVAIPSREIEYPALSLLRHRCRQSAGFRRIIPVIAPRRIDVTGDFDNFAKRASLEKNNPMEATFVQKNSTFVGEIVVKIKIV